MAGVLLNTHGKPNREGRRSPGMGPEKPLTRRIVILYMQDSREKNHQQHIVNCENTVKDVSYSLWVSCSSDVDTGLSRRYPQCSPSGGRARPLPCGPFCTKLEELEVTVRVCFSGAGFNPLLLETAPTQK